MKKIKKLTLLIIAFAALIVTAFAALFSIGGNGGKVYASSYYGDPYYYEFSQYHITYDIRSDRTMDVTVDFAVDYLGSRSTGLLYDIPVNAGDRVRNIEAYLLSSSGEELHLDYKVESEERNLVTVNMDDYSNKTGKTRYYRLKYEYAITRPAKDETDKIYLNAVGGGFNSMQDVKITVNLPEGFTGAQYWSERFGSHKTDTPGTRVTPVGNTVTLGLESLTENTYVTFQFDFNEGVLSVKPDLTPYWIIIGACVILAVLFALKFLCFNKDGLTPVTNVEAPDEMDPLVMGKLIDNKVDKSDVTSLIYYWANKGYLKIDLSNENNIELIRIRTELPANAPNYQKRMYAALFKKDDIVKINSLTNSFYTTVEAVTREVNAENRKLYDVKSMGIAVLLALVGALVMGVTPILLAMFTIHRTLIFILPLFMIIPSFVIFALMHLVRQNRLKLTKGKMALFYCGVALLAVVFSAIYVFFVPSFIIEIVPKIILCAVGFIIVMLSTLLISRTEDYRQKLNKIVGFREFILHAEKDRLEKMLEQNPEFYYQVLPYAIVLGVSDIWENKFAALTVAPPSWSTATPSDRAFNFIVFSSVMRRANTNMTTTFVSRPAPSGGSYSGGGHGGGHFGGFSGGGHGGGGARGR